MRSIEAIPPLEMCTALALFVEVTVFKLAIPSTRRQDVVAAWHSKPPPVIEPLFHTAMIESEKNKVWKDFKNEKIKILYISPESLMRDSVLKILKMYVGSD